MTPKLTPLEAAILARVVRGEDPWGLTPRTNQVLTRLWRKGCCLTKNGRRIATDAGRAALAAHESEGAK